MYKQFLNSKSIVEKILEKYPNTRNSDKALYLKVFEQWDLVLTDEQKKKFLTMPINFESIRRSRQKIQNEEERFLPDKKVIERRKAEQDTMSREVLSEDEKIKRMAQAGIFG